MGRKNLKLRVDNEGCLEVVDPGYDTLELIHSIDPEFKIKMAPLPLFSSPRIIKSKQTSCGLSSEELVNSSDEELWNLHAKILDCPSIETKSRQTDEESFLDLKIELAYRLLKSCRLCGRLCAVDRIAGRKGVCGLGKEATLDEYFVHIAEEPPINPSLNLVLWGCGLQCKFCQRYELLDPEGDGYPLSPFFWNEFASTVARSISFVGGNPDESLYAILKFLSYVPPLFNKPICWNSNGYASRIVYKLLSGIVDVYIPDAKFYSEKCSYELAGCKNYFEMFQAGIEEMVKQDIPIFVRMLVLPGHTECCHLPLIEYLSKYKEKVWLNILGQYYPPDISRKETVPSRKPFLSEMEKLFSYAERLGGPDWLLSKERGTFPGNDPAIPFWSQRYKEEEFTS